jgi:hypothetical protein
MSSQLFAILALPIHATTEERALMQPWQRDVVFALS